MTHWAFKKMFLYFSLFELGLGRISGSAGLSGIQQEKAGLSDIQQEKAGLSGISGKARRIIRGDIRQEKAG